MRELTKKKPDFKVSFTVQRKDNMEIVFNFSHVTTNTNEVVDLMNKLEIKTHELCKVNMY